MSKKRASPPKFKVDQTDDTDKPQQNAVRTATPRKQNPLTNTKEIEPDLIRQTSMPPLTPPPTSITNQLPTSSASHRSQSVSTVPEGSLSPQNGHVSDDGTVPSAYVRKGSSLAGVVREKAPFLHPPGGSFNSENFGGEYSTLGSTRSIYVIYTGGTLGMTYGADGSLRPEPHFLTQKIQSLPEFRSHQMPQIVINEWDVIKDSSDMGFQEAAKLAEEIQANYDSYDGFVVLHGTDTMAYTASTLSFMLENLGKPVIVTGSSIPLCEIYNDARRNVIVSFMYASSSDLCEVCVFFNNVLLRGNRCSKVSVRELNAFWSNNFPPLGKLGVHMTLTKDLLREPPKGHFKVHKEFDENIIQFNLLPGIKAGLVHNMIQPPVKGIIMHTFGAGNGPSDPSLWEVLKKASDRGVYIYILTQCIRGYVTFGEYAAGQGVSACGGISGYDITVESAFAKMGCILGRNLPSDVTRELLASDLRGEMTVDISSDHVPMGL
ncbi:hypothetical protein, variant [Sphaeroforma arctica JP610]|uniref:asparaginase n=1 Tax=Sphaeroforma arctica JP610 TaxID=667725 RepID=A0A0L0GAU7_9EUKA|nr:hypothetical protein, variant [Sphaeroforma arctica JP610]KNC86127.1 hypothetical protein, variant [Sphaeroforma arctica JP610]|eukprot:XP_014160030.1 hypothetical protein, variant [Sphaeroforma arctica JP610]